MHQIFQLKVLLFQDLSRKCEKLFATVFAVLMSVKSVDTLTDYKVLWEL